MFANDSAALPAPAQSRKPGRGNINPSNISHLKLSAAIVCTALIFAWLLPKELYQLPAAKQRAQAVTTKLLLCSAPLRLHKEGAQLRGAAPRVAQTSLPIVHVAEQWPVVLRLLAEYLFGSAMPPAELASVVDGFCTGS